MFGRELEYTKKIKNPNHQKSKTVITAAHFLTYALHYSFLLETHFLTSVLFHGNMKKETLCETVRMR